MHVPLEHNNFKNYNPATITSSSSSLNPTKLLCKFLGTLRSGVLKNKATKMPSPPPQVNEWRCQTQVFLLFSLFLLPPVGHFPCLTSYLPPRPLINALSHLANDVSLINHTSLPSYSSRTNEITGAAFSCDRPWVDSTFRLGVLLWGDFGNSDSDRSNATAPYGVPGGDTQPSPAGLGQGMQSLATQVPVSKLSNWII